MRDQSLTRRFIWETRLMQASPLGVAPTSILIGSMVFATFLFSAWWNDLTLIVTPDKNPTLSPDVWTAICMSLLWGSIFGLGEYTRVANLVDLQTLRNDGVAVDAIQFDALKSGPTRATRIRAQLFGVLGGLSGIVFYNLVYRPDGEMVTLATATLTNFWFFGMTIALFVEIFRNLSYLRADTASLLRDLDHRIRIDFFHIHRLDGLGRIALRRALPWAVASAIVLLMLFAQSSPLFFGPLFGSLMVSAALVFGLPMWRVHVLIDRAKNAELARIRHDMAAARDVFNADATVASASYLSALLALEQRLEHVREWPLDFSTIVRFGFYLALPLGSWLGGALVERALNILTR
tara:strand:+ start:412 stop:1461 length:1050 start_codon:yes stop_codon:yes gene_type:complete